MVTPPRLTLYTRAGCHLCETAKRAIDAVRERVAVTYEEFDIDRDPELQRLYTDEVPVIAIDGRKTFQYAVDTGELLKRLANA